MTTAQVTFPAQRIRLRNGPRTGQLITVKHQPQQQAVRKPNTARAAAYHAQTGHPVTPRQRRRIAHKIDHHHTPKG